MRIALIGSRGYPSTYGGFETFVRELTPRVVGWDHELLVYCRESPNGDRAWTVDGVECRRPRGIDDYHLSTLSYGLTSSLDVRHREIDAALVVNAANGFWLPFIRSAEVPVAVNVDGLEWKRGKWGPIGRAAFRRGAAMSARHATRLVADSRAIAAIWEERYGVRPDYIPYGAEIYDDDADDELTALGIPVGEYSLTVARIVPENNVLPTLDALDLLGDRERPPHVIIGSGFGSRLGRKVHARAVERDDVWHLGHVSNQRLLAQLFRHSLVYIHGHSVGGTNPSLLQALGAGAPALAYDCIFNREVLVEGADIDAPEIFYKDADTLAELLAHVLDSPGLRSELSEHGRERIRTNYQWSDVSREYVALLGELAGHDVAVRVADEPVHA